jgi:PAS domain S-box-containing protein
LFGYSPEEAIGKNIDVLVVAGDDPTTYKEAVSLSNQVSAKQLVGPIETIRYRKDGTAINVILSGSPVSVDNNFEGSVAVYTDISERVRFEVELKESEQRYRSFLQNFQGIAYRGSMDFTPIFFHGAVEEITGYTEAEFVSGKPRWDQVIHPEDLVPCKNINPIDLL